MSKKKVCDFICRAVARSENPVGHIILGGDNVPSLVEIGLTEPPNTAPSLLAST